MIATSVIFPFPQNPTPKTPQLQNPSFLVGSPPFPMKGGEGETEQEEEALRLKAVAEAKFKAFNLKSALKYAKRAQRLAPHLDGFSETLTAFTILRAASKSPTPDWYKVLQVERFAHINTIRQHYKKLALALHPDKNPYVGSEEAFKVVGEAFRFLSDKVRRKEYDMKLRIRIQEEADESLKEGEAFWTACSTCRLLHQFERRYVGHNLVCPSCKKSFKAVEVENNGSEEEEEQEEDEEVKVASLKKKVDGSERLGDLRLRRKMGSLQKSRSVKAKVGSEEVEGLKRGNGSLEGKVGGAEVGDGDLEREGGVGEWSGGRLRSGGLRRRMCTVGEVLERSKPKRVKTGEEMMTLAEFQSQVKRKAQLQKMKSKLKEKKEEDRTEKKSKQGERLQASKNNRGLEVGKLRSLKKRVKPAIKEKREASVKRKGLRLEKHGDSSEGDLEIMAVEDSDFYDFDKDRTERSLKKGQVWAVYDDDDGMPRHYALIDEVISANPFDVRISWLDLQNNGDGKIISWEKMGFHIPCGRFKVARKTSINSVNIFSHVVDCDRAAREVYKIYPKKGSVWALYGEATLDAERRNFAVEGKRCYDIVVFLTSYSEMNGLSMAYLEKVDGYKTLFKRQEMGSHAIRLLEKDDIWLVSHQIPAQKFSCIESPEPLKDCWELDPASLPSDLLAIECQR